MISINNLEFSYKPNAKVLNGINLNLKKGNIYGLIGHNGAGKSTFMKLIMSLLKPCSGEISLNSISKPYSYMPENNGVYDRLTCLENIRLRASLYGLGKKEVKELSIEQLHRFGLTDKSNERAADLSQGLKKRLALACSTIYKSDLIVLDEPTNGVDPSSLNFIQKYIKDLRDDNKIIIISSHDLNTIQEVCGNIIILNHGDKIYDGKVKDRPLIEFYLNKTKEGENSYVFE